MNLSNIEDDKKTLDEEEIFGFSLGVKIRTKLVELVKTVIKPDISYDDRMKYVLFVSHQDSSMYEEAIERGQCGLRLRSHFMTQGLDWVHPWFFGHTVIWNAPETKLCHINDLSKEDLISVVKKQKEILKLMYENRQRL